MAQPDDRRRVPIYLAAFKALTVGLTVLVLSVALASSLLLAADLYLHYRHAGVFANIRGYRGPLLGAKAAGELRVVVLGESAAYGYGVSPDESFPAQLQDMLRQWPGRPVTVANLAYNSESAVCFASTLEQYSNLEPDIILMYSGYNDIDPDRYLRPPWSCFRNASLPFRMTGYMPILPTYVREKYYQLRYGSIDLGYRQHFAVPFLDWLNAIGEDRQDGMRPAEAGGDDEAGEWGGYTALITSVTRSQLMAGRAVIVVTQPYVTAAHRRQQDELRAALVQFTALSHFCYVNLGETVNLGDPALAFDGVHLTKAGNERIAAALVGPIAAVLGRVAGTAHIEDQRRCSSATLQ